MKKFRVTLYKSVTINVEAESEEDVEDYIYNNPDSLIVVDRAFDYWNVKVHISDIWEEK